MAKFRVLYVTNSRQSQEAERILAARGINYLRFFIDNPEHYEDASFPVLHTADQIFDSLRLIKEYARNPDLDEFDLMILDEDSDEPTDTAMVDQEDFPEPIKVPEIPDSENLSEEDLRQIDEIGDWALERISSNAAMPRTPHPP